MLTIAQRHKYYKAALKLIESGDSEFICPALQNVAGLNNYNNVFAAFPEFVNQKPAGKSLGSVWWFSSDYEYDKNKVKKLRIKALRACIEETTSKNSHKVKLLA